MNKSKSLSDIDWENSKKKMNGRNSEVIFFIFSDENDFKDKKY